MCVGSPMDFECKPNVALTSPVVASVADVAAVSSLSCLDFEQPNFVARRTSCLSFCIARCVSGQFQPSKNTRCAQFSSAARATRNLDTAVVIAPFTLLDTCTCGKKEPTYRQQALLNVRFEKCVACFAFGHHTYEHRAFYPLKTAILSDRRGK